MASSVAWPGGSVERLGSGTSSMRFETLEAPGYAIPVIVFPGDYLAPAYDALRISMHGVVRDLGIAA